jgi:hypothetical protein
MAYFRYFIAVLIVLLLSSCRSDPIPRIDEALVVGQYGDALNIHENNKNRLYNNKGEILYELNSGMLNHYAGNYGDSISILQSGERSIEQAFTRSITESIVTFFLNDRNRTYPGEDFEDVYINIFNALNYYHIDQHGSAQVEIRRLIQKLQFIQVKYDLIAAKEEEAYLKNVNTRKAARDTQRLGVAMNYRQFNYKTALNDSVLGRYLGILFYREAGMYDDARIDYEAMERIFYTAVRAYNYQIPSSVREELNVKPNEARLNVISFSGLNPLKGEEKKDYARNYHEKQAARLRLAFPALVTKYKAPTLIDRPSTIGRIELVFNNGRVYQMELLEDLAFTQSELLRPVIEREENQIRKSFLNKMSFLGAISLYFTPVIWLGGPIITKNWVDTDTRISRYFPGQVHVSGIGLDPGVYSFKVNYYNEMGEIITSVPYNNVQVVAGKLNLIEAFCLQ